MSFFERFVKSTITTLLRSCRGLDLGAAGGGGIPNGADEDALVLGDR